MEAIRAEFMTRGSEATLAPGALLWQAGDPSDHTVLLIEGRLEILGEGMDGNVVVLRELNAGAVLGEMSCMDGAPHSATVRSAVTSRLRRLTATAFRTFARAHAEVLEALLLEQSRRVRSLSEQVAALAFESVVRRVAAYLRRNADQEGRVRSTHQDLAERVGATRESVTKALGTLQKTGAVQLTRGQVQIVDQSLFDDV
jgi:CRP-like cAMP-binding protein